MSLFAGLLGDAFASLPASVQRLHLNAGLQRYRGEVEVIRGRRLLSRFCAWATRLPPAGSAPIEVEIIAGHGREQWTRQVAGHAMRSRLWAQQGVLCEQLGLVRFGFDLSVKDGVLHWRVAQVRAFGLLPLPARWFGGVHAQESEREGRYRFDVAAALPLAGLLVHYRGWLHVD